MSTAADGNELSTNRIQNMPNFLELCADYLPSKKLVANQLPRLYVTCVKLVKKDVTVHNVAMSLAFSKHITKTLFLQDRNDNMTGGKITLDERIG